MVQAAPSWAELGQAAKAALTSLPAAVTSPVALPSEGRDEGLGQSALTQRVYLSLVAKTGGVTPIQPTFQAVLTQALERCANTPVNEVCLGNGQIPGIEQVGDTLAVQEGMTLTVGLLSCHGSNWSAARSNWVSSGRLAAFGSKMQQQTICSRS